MAKGDILARGGKQATFQSAKSESEFEHDLKILAPQKCIDKYGITATDYNLFADQLRRGDTLPNLSPSAPLETEPGLQTLADPIDAPEPVFMPAVGAVPQYAEPGAHLAAKASVGYEGDPAGDSVLIQRVEREHTSNLILPDSLKAKSDLGFIKAVGEAVKYYKKGDLVLFDKFASHGADISLIDEDGVERAMLLLREYDILMRLKKVQL